ncbi:hypothetical protein EDEG_03421 [Edhazardia aedis USNM 41457]|uniref:Uncharacterized protein n=1 Tax=Edhazardia aedis (strain USNM 41457) TaxID=1003232 RepID=J8ZR25_EDHAE|nr:hypothetical protein EDEG_03421 [Edhazardia aedis USNM 41457]|eukprot:EJW02133.1 hypothetical protein EDEG_03421 [Edhazardia aedis USNM 41457]
MLRTLLYCLKNLPNTCTKPPNDNTFENIYNVYMLFNFNYSNDKCFGDFFVREIDRVCLDLLENCEAVSDEKAGSYAHVSEVISDFICCNMSKITGYQYAKSIWHSEIFKSLEKLTDCVYFDKEKHCLKIEKEKFMKEFNVLMQSLDLNTAKTCIKAMEVLMKKIYEMGIYKDDIFTKIFKENIMNILKKIIDLRFDRKEKKKFYIKRAHHELLKKLHGKTFDMRKNFYERVNFTIPKKYNFLWSKLKQFFKIIEYFFKDINNEINGKILSTFDKERAVFYEYFVDFLFDSQTYDIFYKNLISYFVTNNQKVLFYLKLSVESAINIYVDAKLRDFDNNYQNIKSFKYNLDKILSEIAEKLKFKIEKHPFNKYFDAMTVQSGLEKQKINFQDTMNSKNMATGKINFFTTFKNDNNSSFLIRNLISHDHINIFLDFFDHNFPEMVNGDRLKRPDKIREFISKNRINIIKVILLNLIDMLTMRFPHDCIMFYSYEIDKFKLVVGKLEQTVTRSFL